MAQADGSIIINTEINGEGAEKGVSRIKTAVSNGSKAIAKIGAAALSAAAAGIAAITKQAVEAFSEYEQLAGGMEKIFDKMDPSEILEDAANAYYDLGLSANEYLAVINDVGAAFAATMGDEAGYKTARQGLKAISDFASGTGKSVDELSEKFALITRSTSSYQSIADQFSGVLPATSAEFLKQAQAAGLLSKKYKKLTAVPVAEYQAAVAAMLERGVTALGLAGNTAAEATNTISGSLAALKAAWSNTIVALADENADFDKTLEALTTSAVNVVKNLAPRIQQAVGGVGKLITGLAPVIAETLPGLLTSLLPALLEAASSLLNSIVAALPGLLSTLLPLVLQSALDVIMTLADGLIQNIPVLTETITDIILHLADMLTQPEMLINLINAALMIILALAEGLIEATPRIIEKIPEIIENLVVAIVGALPLIIGAGVQLVLALAEGIANNFAALASTGKDMVKMIGGGLTEKAKEALTWGKDLIQNFIDGIKAKWESLKSTVSGVAQSVRDFLGFSEPDKGPLSNFHTYAPDMIDLFTKGITAGIPQVRQAVSEVARATAQGMDIGNALNVLSAVPIKTSYVASGKFIPPAAEMTYNARAGAGRTQSAVTAMTTAMVDELRALGDRIEKMQVVLDSGRTVGGLLTETDRQLGSKQILAARGVK